MCDCKEQECRVNNKFLTKSLIYIAKVKSKNDTKSYVSSTGLSFKNPYTKHKYSFKHEKYDNTTTLSSTYIN